MPALAGFPVPWEVIYYSVSSMTAGKQDSHVRSPAEVRESQLPYEEVLLSLDLKVEVKLKCHHVLLEGSFQNRQLEALKTWIVLRGEDKYPKHCQLLARTPALPQCDLGQPIVPLLSLAILN